MHSSQLQLSASRKLHLTHGTGFALDDTFAQGANGTGTQFAADTSSLSDASNDVRGPIVVDEVVVTGRRLTCSHDTLACTLRTNSSISWIARDPAAERLVRETCRLVLPAGIRFPLKRHLPDEPEPVSGRTRTVSVAVVAVKRWCRHVQTVEATVGYRICRTCGVAWWRTVDDGPCNAWLQDGGGVATGVR